MRELPFRSAISGVDERVSVGAASKDGEIFFISGPEPDWLECVALNGIVEVTKPAGALSALRTTHAGVAVTIYCSVERRITYALGNVRTCAVVCEGKRRAIQALGKGSCSTIRTVRVNRASAAWLRSCSILVMTHCAIKALDAHVPFALCS
eukprot:516299-Rhodomonas_salina.1